MGVTPTLCQHRHHITTLNYNYTTHQQFMMRHSIQNKYYCEVSYLIPFLGHLSGPLYAECSILTLGSEKCVHHNTRLRPSTAIRA